MEFIKEDDLKKLQEEENGTYLVKGILQRAGAPNQNKRRYPKEILKRECDKYQQLIKKGGALNELNHPSSSLIDLDRVSHSILETWWDGKMLMGKIKLLTSPGWKKMGIVSTKGDQAAMLLMNGATLGISSRGVGSLKKVGEQNEVQKDFELICFDLVSSPSTPGAYLFTNPEDRGKFEENLEEEKVMRQPDIGVSEKGMNRSIDLLNKLNHYLNK